MKKNTNQKNLIFLLSLLFIFTIVWVASNVYHNLYTSTIDIPLASSIRPIDGTFDTKTIEEIKNRKRVEITSDIITPTENVQIQENIATTTAQLNDDVEIEVGTESAETNL